MPSSSYLTLPLLGNSLTRHCLVVLRIVLLGLHLFDLICRFCMLTYWSDVVPPINRIVYLWRLSDLWMYALKTFLSLSLIDFPCLLLTRYTICKLWIIDVALEIPVPLSILFIVVSWWTQFNSFVMIIIPWVGFLVSVLGPTIWFDSSMCCLTLRFGPTYPLLRLWSIGKSGNILRHHCLRLDLEFDECIC